MAQFQEVESRLDSIPIRRMSFEYWIRFVYGYEPWDYDLHLQHHYLEYKKILWS